MIIFTYGGRDGMDWDNAYIINTPADMYTLAEYAGDGKYYKLNADITLTAKPKWSESGKKFNGYLDGQNHTIDYSNISDMSPLFNEVSMPEHAETPAIQKLNVKGSVTVALSSFYAGGIVGQLSTGIIDSCTFSGNIRLSTSNIGGIAGRIVGGTIRNCTASGTFRGANNVGGIVGYMNYNASNTVENCTVLNGTRLYASGTSGSNTGGIAAYMERGTITGCTSYAVLSDAQCKGGILGFLYYRYDGDVNNITNNRYANADLVIGNRSDSGAGNTMIDGNSAPEPDTGTDNSTDDSTGNDSNTDNNTGNDSNTGNNTGNNTNTGNGTDGTNTNTNTNSDSSDDDDSGCNSGFSAFMLIGAVILKFRRH